MAQHARFIAADVTAAGSERTPSLNEQVYERVRDDILCVRLRPGELLLEPELARLYGVSKTPVREALRLLVHEGWLMLLPRKGYLVRPLQLDDIREVFAIRGLLEPPLFADLARHPTPERLAALQADLERQRTAPDLDSSLAAARDFHLACAELSNNRRATEILSNLLDEMQRLHYLMPNVQWHISSTSELEAHAAIVAAIETGDGVAVEAAVREHLLDVSRGMIAAYSE